MLAAGAAGSDVYISSKSLRSDVCTYCRHTEITPTGTLHVIGFHLHVGCWAFVEPIRSLLQACCSTTAHDKRTSKLRHAVGLIGTV
jgi:hypothetical protein